MNFLAAKKIIDEAPPQRDVFPLSLCMSGLADPLTLYLQAAAIESNRELRLTTLPFGTLGQHLDTAAPCAHEVLLLYPWDILPELDWRTGVTEKSADSASTQQRVEDAVADLSARGSAIVYNDAAIPALLVDQAANRALRDIICAQLRECGAIVLGEENFALSQYLRSGCPIAPKAMGQVARAVRDALLAVPPGRSKVLVTDLDHTLWSGTAGDDGPAAVNAAPEGIGYKHFLYQTLLARLRRQGVLLAAVTKNDPEIAHAALQRSDMPLGDADFVAVLASWSPKSVQINNLAEQLNLSLDAFVFVDDNPVEREEVSKAIPQIRTFAFPEHEDALPALFDALGVCFSQKNVTQEDQSRTELYRRRLAGLAPHGARGADLRDFLQKLQMRLDLHRREPGVFQRAIQLLNKTNQFNLNGRRWQENEVETLLAEGGQLWTATLRDCSGSHGEIMAALISADGTVHGLVMSCRVFQRRVEDAFLLNLFEYVPHLQALEFAPTERNGPLCSWLESLELDVSIPQKLVLHRESVQSKRASALELFHGDD